MWVHPALVDDQHLHELIVAPWATRPAQLIAPHYCEDSTLEREVTSLECVTHCFRKTRADSFQVLVQSTDEVLIHPPIFIRHVTRILLRRTSPLLRQTNGLSRDGAGPHDG